VRLGLARPAPLEQRDAEVEVGNGVAGGDVERVLEQGDAVVPDADLGRGQGGQRRQPRQGGRDRRRPGHAAQRLGQAPGDHQRDAYQRQIRVTVRVRLLADLHEPDHGHQHAEVPQPAHRELRPRAPPA
jgi:hypothetical protein